MKVSGVSFSFITQLLHRNESSQGSMNSFRFTKHMGFFCRSAVTFESQYNGCCQAEGESVALANT